MKMILVAALAFLAALDASGASLLAVQPASGLFEQPITLTAAARIPGAEIRFARGGALPARELWKEGLVISNTAVLRFAVFQNGQRTGPIETRTYIFPAGVLSQTGQGLPAAWGVKSNLAVRADYEMDPEVLDGPDARALAVQGLRAIPTVSIVMPMDDLFGESRGIYSHPEESGEAWERVCSFEWITPGQPGVQTEAGLRIQGGWNRRPEESPKHAFRLVFRKKYGAKKLDFPLFGPAGPAEFNSLILRAGCNNSWLHWSGAERHRGEFIRDQWMRDAYREMGHPSAAGAFVHLYLNGVYWGLYNLTERPDASFAALHLGGAADDYDSFNASKLLHGTRDAWDELMRRLKAGVKTKQDLARAGELIDLSAFADFMLLNLYGANADWDRSSNWYAARRRTPPGRFQFFVWDAERTLEQPANDTTAFADDESPPGIFHQLIGCEPFRALFAQRARLRLSAGGELGPAKSAERYRRWAEAIDLPILLESARWGDYRRDVHRYKEGPYELYTRAGHWQPEVKRLLEAYFPQRTAIVLDQFRKNGWVE